MSASFNLEELLLAVLTFVLALGLAFDLALTLAALALAALALAALALAALALAALALAAFDCCLDLSFLFGLFSLLSLPLSCSWFAVTHYHL